MCYRSKQAMAIPLVPGEYYYFYRSSHAKSDAKLPNTGSPAYDEDGPAPAAPPIDQIKGRKHCANEGDICSCVGIVFYGNFRTNRWKSQYVSEYWGMIACDNSAFYPDPTPWMPKTCECLDVRILAATEGIEIPEGLSTQGRMAPEKRLSASWSSPSSLSRLHKLIFSSFSFTLILLLLIWVFNPKQTQKDYWLLPNDEL